MVKTIRFNVDDVMQQLSIVAGVVNQKNTIPILGSIMWEVFTDASGGKWALLTASDSETWLSIKAQVIEYEGWDGAQSDGICIDARNIIQALRGLQGKELVMEANVVKHFIRCSYGNGEFELPFDDGEQFPKPKECGADASSITLGADVIQRAILTTKYACANDELRPQLNGIRFDFHEGCMVNCATDGHKLVRLKTKVESGLNDIGFTLPKKPSQALTNVLDKVEKDVVLKFDNTNAVFRTTDFKLTTRLLEGKYPNYEMVIPKEIIMNAALDKEEALLAINRVSTFGNKSSELTVMEIKKEFGGNDGICNIECDDVDFSTSAHEYFDVKLDDVFPDEMRIGFKGSFLVATIANVPNDTVTVGIIDSTHAVMFTGGDASEYCSILMPMALA